ncbi:MAG TPA: Ig-like domain-containing protein [Solirubrobacteraceae bacterium]|nr:Ig-like domain-containing protein [Solirubrobacteraceae bacterium]
MTLPAAPAPVDLTSTGSAPAAQGVTIEIPAGGSVALLDGDAAATNSLSVDGEGVYTLDATDGRLTFEPAAGFSGDARAVTYRITDAYGQSATATYGPAVTPPPAPAAPTLTSTGIGTAVHTQTLPVPAEGSARLLGSGGATAVTVTVAGEGTYVLDPETGAVTFAPVLGFAGTTSIGYRVTDGYGQHTAGSYRPTVQPPAPAAAADYASIGIGTQPQHEILAIPAGATITLLDAHGRPVGSVLVPGEGIYTLSAATGAVSFVPLLGFRGTATPVGYRITDAYGQQSHAIYRPTVTAPAPVAAPAQSTSGAAGAPQSQAIAVPEGGSISLVDADGRSTSTLRVEGVGTYAVDPATGIVTFTPAAAFGGTPPAVLYRIIDAYGQVSEGTYTVTVAVAATDSSPAPAPAAAPAPAVGAVCASRRTMAINWIVRPRVRLRRIFVTVNGRRTASLSGNARRTTVDMRGRPAQRVKVVITGVTSSGTRLRSTRTYRTCVRSQVGPRLPTLRLR